MSKVRIKVSCAGVTRARGEERISVEEAQEFYPSSLDGNYDSLTTILADGVLAIWIDHSRHEHDESEDEDCGIPDLLILVERDARHRRYLWSGADGSIEEVSA